MPWADAHFTAWTISATSLYPAAASTYNLGTTSYPVNNIYLQNAAIVVSDENYKSNITEITGNTEYETLVAAIGTVKFSMWQLKTAISEKGENGARKHAGVVAQQVKTAITDAGLDWEKYGVIAYEKHTQVVTKGEDGYYYPVLSSDKASAIPVNSSGYIDEIEGADSLTTADDGTITYTREAYMLRMEEFFSLRMAYIESCLS
ncbi:tail fiber domain-containing protein [Klebsiella pneumoniae]|nr:tail fiber domain-containing protein [Klebsiella pneumoniae]